MYDDDFRAMFIEFVHEYSDNQEMLDTLIPFLSYGWGTVNMGDGPDKAREEDRRGFILWMADNGASLDAMEAIIRTLKKI